MSIIDLKKPGEVGISFGPDSRIFSLYLDYNLLFLKTSEALLNDLLKTRGFLTKNDVVMHLGYPPVLSYLDTVWQSKDGELHFKITEEINFIDVVITQS